MEHRRAPGLDTLRGGAILSVLIFHYFNNAGVFRTPGLLWLQDLTSHFFLGVDLFFVLSGFLIGGSLMASRGDATYFSAYISRRVGRIFPLYFLWLALFLLMKGLGAEKLGGAFPWLLQMDGIPIASYLTFTQNYAAVNAGSWGPAWLSVTWSLAVEMHFYILAAVAIYFVPVRYVGALSIMVIALAAWLRMHGGYSDAHKIVITQTRIDMAFGGVFAAWLASYFREFIARYAATLRIISISAIAALWLNYSYFEIPIPTPMRPGLVAFAFAVIAFSPPIDSTANAAVRFVRWCGVRCYGIYIIHVGILGLTSHVIFNLPPNSFTAGQGWPAILLALPITFGLAAVSWRWFEKPILIAVSSPNKSRSSPSEVQSRKPFWSLKR